MFLFILLLLLIGAFLIASGVIGLFFLFIFIDIVVFVEIIKFIFFRKKR